MASLRIHGANILLLIAVLTVTATAGAAEPGLLSVIRQELARLNITPQCEDRSVSCVFSRVFAEDEQALQVAIRHDENTHTVYLYIDRYIVLPEDAEPTQALATKLLSLNNKLVTAKFEWDDAANVIRLSTTLNTDSNFDRKAFRSQLKGLLRVAEKLRSELRPFDQEN